MDDPSPNNRTLYAVWLCVAVAVIVSGFLFNWLTTRSFQELIRQSLRNQKQAGTLPPEWQSIDVETVDISKLGDFQMKVPHAMELRLQIALFLTDLWYVWIPIVVLLCLAMATIMRRRE
jgi:hypothetical protein